MLLDVSLPDGDSRQYVEHLRPVSYTHLDVYKRQVVVLLALIGAGSCLGYSYFTYEPMYECSATFTVATGNEDSGSYNFYYSKSTADQLSKTFPYILDSSFFRSALLEKLGTSSLNGTLTSETVSNSNLVTMKVQSTNAQDAKSILDAALEIYPETARFVLGGIQFNLLDEPQLPQQPSNGGLSLIHI